MQSQEAAFLKNIKSRWEASYKNTDEGSDSKEEDKLEFIKNARDTIFRDVIKGNFLQRREEMIRIRAMRIVRSVIIDFILSELKVSGADLRDQLQKFLNEIVLELFDRVRDIYCV